MKKILISVLSVVGALVIAFIACFFAVPDFNAWVSGKINSGSTGGDADDKQDDKNNTENKDGEDNGSAEIDNGENNGISLYSAKMPRAAYSVNGVDPQADSAFMLTAVVEPEDAADKTVNWHIAWQNENSSFAKGKTVTDYVTVTPTADGTLTATAICKQAFGEPIVITVTPRKGDSTVRGTCNVNYVQKFLGLELNAACTYSSCAYSFNVSSTNSSTSINFPVFTSLELWGMCLTNSQYSSFNRSIKRSEVYTKALQTGSQDNYYEWSGYKVCATQDYLDALRAGGSSVSATAEIYKYNGSDYFGSFFFTNWGTMIGSWSNFLSSLRQNSDKVMLRIKFYANTNVGTEIGTCDIKFNADSVAALLTSITLNDIDF